MSPRSISSALYWSLLEIGAGQLLGAALYFVLARLLSPSDFGLVAVAQALIVLLQLLGGFGAAQLIIRAPAGEEELYEVVFTINLIGSVAAFVLLCAGEWIYVLRYDADPTVMLIHIVIAMTMPLSSLYVVNQALQVKALNFRAVAIRTVSSQFIAGSLGVVAALNGWGPWSLVVWRVCMVCVEGILATIQQPWTMRLNIRSTVLRREVVNGVKITFVQIVSVADHRITEIVMAFVLGMSNLALFTVSRRLFEVLTQLAFRPFMNVSLSAFSQNSDRDNIRERYVGFATWICWASFPLALIIYFSSEIMIRITLGDKWINAIQPFRLMLLNIPFYAIFYSYEPILITMGRLSELAVIRCIQCGCVLFFGVVAMFYFRTVSAAVLGQVFGMAIFSIILLRVFVSLLHLNVSELAKALAPAALCGVGGFLFGSLIDGFLLKGVFGVLVTALGTAVIFGIGFATRRPPSLSS